MYNMTSDELKSKINSSNIVTIESARVEGNVEIMNDSDSISVISFYNCLFHDDVVIEINDNCYITFTNCKITDNIYIRNSYINNLDFLHVDCKDFTISDSTVMNSRFKYIECIGNIRLNNTTIYESFIVTVQSYTSIDINSSLFIRDTIHNIAVFMSSCLNVFLNTAFNSCSIMGISIWRVYIYNGKFRYTSISECVDANITTYNSNIRDMITQLCPEEGSFIGYKKVIDASTKILRYIAVLEIPADADRLTGINGKCRCSKAKVLRIETAGGKILSDAIGISHTHYSMIKYIPGEMVYPDSFDDNVLVECSHGIHFFMSKKEAIDY